MFLQIRVKKPRRLRLMSGCCLRRIEATVFAVNITPSMKLGDVAAGEEEEREVVATQQEEAVEEGDLIDKMFLGAYFPFVFLASVD